MMTKYRHCRRIRIQSLTEIWNLHYFFFYCHKLPQLIINIKFEQFVIKIIVIIKYSKATFSFKTNVFVMKYIYCISHEEWNTMNTFIVVLTYSEKTAFELKKMMDAWPLKTLKPIRDVIAIINHWMDWNGLDWSSWVWLRTMNNRLNFQLHQSTGSWNLHLHITKIVLSAVSP